MVSPGPVTKEGLAVVVALKSGRKVENWDKFVALKSEPGFVKTISEVVESRAKVGDAEDFVVVGGRLVVVV